MANYSVGKHFETRLAHVHGNLFAFLNILIGYLLLHFRDKLKHVSIISWLALTGLLMPLGILAEVYLGLPPIFVLIGAMAMTASVIWLGISFYKMGYTPEFKYSAYNKSSTIKESEVLTNGIKSVENILSSLKIIIELQREIFGLAADANDEGTGALMSDYIRFQEKEVWMYSAYLKN